MKQILILMKVTIIGAGIGGLTTALALKKANIPFQLVESAPEIKAVGAGIILANNAMQVFEKLGIHKQIEKQGNKINQMLISKANFSPLSELNLEPFEKKYHLQNHAIHRADLHRILVQAIGEEQLILNKKLTNIEQNDSTYMLKFEDGSTLETTYIIGADGIHSKVRELFFGDCPLRDSKQWCWRGVSTFQPPNTHRALEAWGAGARFGMVPLSSDKVYWYFTLNDHLGDLNDSLDKHSYRFHSLAQKIIDATPVEQHIKTKIFDLKPIHQWQKDRVCLLGDAAHATTPNLGQGACQAIEDAYILGELMQKHDIQKAFEMYPEIRRKKAHFVVNTSWKFGGLAQIENKFGQQFRNFIVKNFISKRSQEKQLEHLFQLDEIPN